MDGLEPPRALVHSGHLPLSVLRVFASPELPWRGIWNHMRRRLGGEVTGIGRGRVGCWRVIKRERRVYGKERGLRNSFFFSFPSDCVMAVVPALHTYIYISDGYLLSLLLTRFLWWWLPRLCMMKPGGWGRESYFIRLEVRNDNSERVMWHPMNWVRLCSLFIHHVTSRDKTGKWPSFSMHRFRPYWLKITAKNTQGGANVYPSLVYATWLQP